MEIWSVGDMEIYRLRPQTTGELADRLPVPSTATRK